MVLVIDGCHMIKLLLLDEKLGDKHKLLTIEDGGHYGFSENEDNLIRQTIASFLIIEDIENYKK